MDDNVDDARFMDGVERPLKLLASDERDLEVISALVQDAIAERKEMKYEPGRKSFALLLRRFRWEDESAAKAQARSFERIQSVLLFQSVDYVQFSGFDASDEQLVFDLIGIAAGDDAIRLIFAGNGEIALHCECIDVILSDVSRPYNARAKTSPHHQIE